MKKVHFLRCLLTTCYTIFTMSSLLPLFVTLMSLIGSELVSAEEPLVSAPTLSPSALRTVTSRPTASPTPAPIDQHSGMGHFNMSDFLILFAFVAFTWAAGYLHHKFYPPQEAHPRWDTPAEITANTVARFQQMVKGFYFQTVTEETLVNASSKMASNSKNDQVPDEADANESSNDPDIETGGKSSNDRDIQTIKQTKINQNDDRDEEQINQQNEGGAEEPIGDTSKRSIADTDVVSWRPSRYEECPICLEEFDVGATVCKSKQHGCDHVFHEECIKVWLLQHDNCPCCRTNVMK